ncbi:DUF1702 family protein [Naumannella halotolerans]|uniref:Uncharacterized protein DUF1702 n=1 Tax=Naumannella halotolerans TaxID=993414 RepID=A0A4R7J1H3_9ACTN|nr:DUF1702 family protein [Naumannella halotolerans]TDT30099.1 uncharacterized protein DUF1702 [Naumannella halotolerans]
MTALGLIRRRLFGVSSAAAVFSSDGFSPMAWTKFNHVANTLVHGYHAALRDPRPARLTAELATTPNELRGIAWEGAGMGLGALDSVDPSQRWVMQYGNGAAKNHLYPFYIGVGMALARLRRPPERSLPQLDPVVGWVIADGYGFHETFFRRQRHAPYVPVPDALTSYSQQMFDQGVGRALWFSLGADADLVNFHIRGFEPHRHEALWTGVALAGSYCGGNREQLKKVTVHAAPFRTQLAVGSAIAAWGRAEAASPASHTQTACEVFADTSFDEAARIASRARDNVPSITGSTSAMELWRLGIADAFGSTLSISQGPETKPEQTQDLVGSEL